MAKPVDFEYANEIFYAPKGHEDKVQDLPTFCDETCIISAWRLSPEELAEVARTGVVWLYIEGGRMYPLRVEGEVRKVFELPEGSGGPSVEQYIPRKDRQTS